VTDTFVTAAIYLLRAKGRGQRAKERIGKREEVEGRGAKP